MATFPGIFLLIPVSFLLIGLYRRLALRFAWVDTPSHRSSHDNPTPHGAGIVIALMWCLFGVGFHISSRPMDVAMITTMAVATGIALISFCDDIHHLSPLIRLALHTVAAVIVGTSFFSLSWPLSWHLPNIFVQYTPWILFVFLTVWSTNLYNFMDGIDGQASVQAFFIFGTIACLLFLKGDTVIAPLLVALLCLIAGFMLWNLPPAKVFIGDAGSTFLGFIVVPVAVMVHAKYAIPFSVWVLLYFYFLGDTFLTLTRRVLNGEKFYLAHKTYAFQRLYQSGFSRWGVLCAMVAMNALFSALALVAYFYPEAWAICLVLAGFFYLAFYLWIEIRKPMH